MAAEGEQVADQAARPRASAQTRGFLFADIRGYTEYIERYGAEAASELLARYRAIVRAAIADNEGAEIRTEGDSFYVVLPSASAAVMCGLSIAERLAGENARDPQHPIRVGVGVHAGEAIETDQGLVGTAVNIAARLAGLAKPGEVLVSETVRNLTRSVFPVAYNSRGRHRLKGVAEPQEVFAALPSTAVERPRSRSRLRSAAVLGIAGGITVLALLSVNLLGSPTPIPRPSGTATAVAGVPTGSASRPSAPASQPASAPASGATPVATQSPTVIGPSPEGVNHPAMRPGSYQFSAFAPALDFQIDPAWTDRSWHWVVSSDDRALLVLTLPGRDCCGLTLAEGPAAGVMAVQFLRLRTVLDDPCNGGDPSSAKVLSGGDQELIDWIRNHRFLDATNLRSVTVGDWSGLSIDATVKGDPGMECAGLNVPHQGSVNLFRMEDSAIPISVFRLHDGEHARFIVLDIGEKRPLVLLSWSRADDFQLLVPWSDDLLETITLGQDE